MLLAQSRVIGRAPATLRQKIIAGHTTALGQPVSQPVKVYSRANGALLGSTVSNAAGSYKLYLPDDLAYTIVAIDRSQQYNAVIQDNVVPK